MAWTVGMVASWMRSSVACSDAESGGGGDAEAGEVVADVGGSGDFGFDVDPGCVGGVEDCAESGVFGEGVGGPAGVDLGERGSGAGPRAVDPGDEVSQEVGGGVAVEGGCGADIDVEGAQVRSDRVALAAGDSGVNA